MELASRFAEDRHGILHVGVYQGEGTKDTPRPLKWLGTGFVVDQDCTFVTAKHVLANADRDALAVRIQNPGDLSKAITRPVRVLFESPTHDVALLKVDRIDGKPCSSGSLHVFGIFSGDLSAVVGKDIFIVGFPKIGEADVDIPVIRTGVVSSTEISWSHGPMILLDLAGVPGFSGSPVVLTDTNEVIGVVFGPGPTKRAFGFEWATPFTPGDYSKAREGAQSLGQPESEL
jgi:S1-C subfamily serine protease